MPPGRKQEQSQQYRIQLTPRHNFKVHEADRAESDEGQVQDQRQLWMSRNPVAQPVEALVRGPVRRGMEAHPAGFDFIRRGDVLVCFENIFVSCLGQTTAV